MNTRPSVGKKQKGDSVPTPGLDKLLMVKGTNTFWTRIYQFYLKESPISSPVSRLAKQASSGTQQ